VYMVAFLKTYLFNAFTKTLCYLAVFSSYYTMLRNGI